ncbi:sensor histidine kinase [Micromonospora sp. PTRAS2]
MHAERSVRGWVGCHPWASSTLLAAAVLVGSAIARRGPDEPPLPQPSAGGWVLVVLSCAALVVRLRWPVRVWAATLALCVLATVVDGGIGRAVPAVLVAVYTVAAWRPLPVALGAALGSVTAFLVASVAVSSGPVFSEGAYAVAAFVGMVCAIGIAVRSQRAVVAAAQERAHTAELTREEEAQRRVVEERLRIARELHDVVAHHISVVNVQAGVARHLLVSDVAAADAALGTVRESAALVLREMGSVIGLLRTTEEPAGTEPTPGADHIDRLVADGRRAGLDVAVAVNGTPRTLAPVADLAAYRLVQEALTNARRHGAGQVRLTLDWTPGGLVVDVRNRVRPEDAGARGPSGTVGGHGLVGMRERVTAAGGRLDVGRDDDTFTVRATLPYGEPQGAPSVAQVPDVLPGRKT